MRTAGLFLGRRAPYPNTLQVDSIQVNTNTPEKNLFKPQGLHDYTIPLLFLFLLKFLSLGPCFALFFLYQSVPPLTAELACSGIFLPL